MNPLKRFALTKSHEDETLSEKERENTLAKIHRSEMKEEGSNVWILLFATPAMMIMILWILSAQIISRNFCVVYVG